MKCHKCEYDAAKGTEGYCKRHFIEAKEAEYLDLTNDGFFKWVKTFLSEFAPNNFADYHKDIVTEFFKLYNPVFKNRYDRQLELIAHRGAAKSNFFSTFIPLYILVHNGKEITIWADTIENGEVVKRKIKVRLNERLITIVSKTASLAEEFVLRIRNELSSNRRFRFFYGGKIQNAMDEIEGEWTKKAFKYNNCYILGVGSGQQIRGRVKGAYRPSLILFDDLFDETNITDINRGKINKWFYAGAMGSLDDVVGKALLAGTIVHDDTVLVDCEKSTTWKTMKFYPMPVEKFKELAKVPKVIWDSSPPQCILPFDHIENEVLRVSKNVEYFENLQKEKDWGLTWERIDLYYMMVKYKDAVQTNSVATFYQEFFHITIPEELKKFKPEYFQPVGEWRVFHEFGYTWFECKQMYAEPQIINIEFGLDIAGATTEADNTVITPVGALPDNRLIVFPQSYGKMNIRDVLYADSMHLFRYDRIMLNPEYIQKKGFLDETFRMYLIYKPRIIKIGVSGDENQFPEEMRLLFQSNSVPVNVLPRPQHVKSGSKIERIRNSLLGRYQTLSVFHCKGNDLLETELEFLGKHRTDDCADSLEVANFNITVPPAVSYKQFIQPVIQRKVPFGRGAVTSKFDWKSCN